PVADYNITGNPNPDCKCNYWLDGEYEGKPCILREDNVWSVWWSDDYGIWLITRIKGDLSFTEAWERDQPGMVGIYVPGGGTTGNPVVSAGPH
ncbi:MAG: hypothetical protein MUP16_05445, partial [Sedimentisphaerales bacterium]|nr:hypothetical protein [Sedimentisphaerales bacterium]